MGSSLAWVSAHSASGSDPATMPAPASSRARCAVELGAADRDRALSVAARVDPADRSAVASAVEALRAGAMASSAARAGRAVDRRRRVEQPRQVDGARRRGAGAFPDRASRGARPR